MFGAIIAILSLIFSLWECFFNPNAKKSDTDEMKSNQSEIIEVMSEYKKANNSELMKKYPLGYALFYANIDDPVIYSPAKLRNDFVYEIDWEKSQIERSKEKPGCMVLSLPDIRFKKTNSVIEETVFIFPLREGWCNRPIRGFMPVDLWIEVLLVRKEYFVCIMGFTELS